MSNMTFKQTLKHKAMDKICMVWSYFILILKFFNLIHVYCLLLTYLCIVIFFLLE